jgi:hypothetical protein
VGQNRLVMTGRIDLGLALAWTGPGPVRTAHQSAAGGLEATLAGLGFHVRELEGERIVSPESLFAEVARALGLEGRPAGWEDFADARRDADLPELLAVLWNRADHSAFFNLKTVIEAATAFLEWDAERAGAGRQVALFLLGQTRDYPRPGPG